MKAELQTLEDAAEAGEGAVRELPGSALTSRGMEKLERNPFDVLESLIKLAESIDADWNRSPAQSRPLAMALAEVRWLHGKALQLPRRVYIQERLGYLANHLRALVGTRDRAWELQQCRSEIDRLQTPMCFGQLQSSEIDSSTPS